MNGAWLDVDKVLSEYADFRDPKQWALASRETSAPGAGASERGDPRDLPGLAGAYNRLDDVLTTLEKYGDRLPYSPSSDERRWLPHGATGAPGARIYGHPEDRSACSWLYNGHDHGLAPKRNLSAYDVLRRGFFDELDKSAAPDTSITALPSTEAIDAWLTKNRPDVVAEAQRAQEAAARANFDGCGFTNLNETEGPQPGATEAPKAEQRSNRKPLVYHKTPRDILTRHLPEQRYALYPWFPMGTVSFLVAMGGYGKGWLLLLMSICKALGLDFCGRPCTPGRVVFVSGEDELNELQRRVQKVLRYLVDTLGVSIDWDLLEANFDIVDRVGCGAENMMTRAQGGGTIPTDLPEFFAAQIGTAELTVFDTKSRFTGGMEENDNAAASEFIKACEVIAVRTRGAVAVSAHTGKAQGREGIVDQYSVRGASSIGDDSRSQMVLAAPTDAQKKMYEFDLAALEIAGVFRMAHTKHNRSKKADDVFFKRLDNGVVVPFTPKKRGAVTEEERTRRLLDYIGPGEITRKRVKQEYRDIFGEWFAQDEALEIFADAISAGLLVLSKTYNQAKHYRLSDGVLKALEDAWNSDGAVTAPAASAEPGAAPKTEETPAPRKERKQRKAAPKPPATNKVLSVVVEPARAREDEPAAPQPAVEEPTPASSVATEAAPVAEPTAPNATEKPNGKSNGHAPASWKLGPDGRPVPLMRFDFAILCKDEKDARAALAHYDVRAWGAKPPRNDRMALVIEVPTDAASRNSLLASVRAEMKNPHSRPGATAEIQQEKPQSTATEKGDISHVGPTQ